MKKEQRKDNFNKRDNKRTARQNATNETKQREYRTK